MELLRCLGDFSNVSGYKVNELKSKAMRIKGIWPTELSKKVKFNWSPNDFRYMGITITSEISQLCKAHYGKLIDQIQKDFQRWEILPLSFFGRIETVRMNILPRLLYLFSSLPMWIPATNFKNFRKMISNFIWQKKKPRIKFTQLTSCKAYGGLNLPNLNLYYWAAQLCGAVEWLRQSKEITWLTLEQSSCYGIPIQLLALCSNKTWNKYKIENPWMKCTQKVLNTVRKRINAPKSISRAMKISDLIKVQDNWIQGSETGKIKI